MKKTFDLEKLLKNFSNQFLMEFLEESLLNFLQEFLKEFQKKKRILLKNPREKLLESMEENL